MKKIFLMAIAAAAISFTSCGNKSNQAAPETVEANAEAKAAAENIISAMSQSIEKKDVAKLQEAVEQVRRQAAEFIANNPEEAKAYLTQVQTYLKENAESVKSVVGENTVASNAVNLLTNTSADDIVNGISNVLNTKAADVQEAGDAAVEEGKSKAAEKINEAAEKASQKVQEKVNEAKDKAVEETKAKTKETVNQAKEDLKKNLGF
ncbi:MAG: hypothetical protein IJS97_07620 [Prevotella sp.]|nr:hypothetical protein [Prevotella sp.]